MRSLLALAASLLLPLAPLCAQITRPAVPGQPPPPARLADLDWLVGTWEGQRITGPAREIYLPAVGGQIAGHFTQARGDGIWFYEIVAIVQVGDSLEYRLRHFNDDLTGWEECAQVLRFPLVAVEDGSWYFDDLTLRRDGPDGLIGAVRIHDPAAGTSREAVFRYRRVR
jgi:hypothetical protein